MVLPSNASFQTFPDNRPVLYRIRLPEMMHLQRHWKVGWINVILVSLGNSETMYGPFNITVKNIETVGDLIDGLNLSDHISIRFLPRDTLSMVEIRTFRRSTLRLNAY